jgi:peptide chain release factor
MNNEIILQITSGRGPAECCRAVSQVLKAMIQETDHNGIIYKVISRTPGSEAGTLVSALVKFSGSGVDAFIKPWIGTILWVGQSPYRKFHKRKNWYVGVNRIEPTQMTEWKERDIEYQTLRSSGPGGQHVNKTESAVRAIHIPSGLQVAASDSRSQIQNKKLATERLYAKWLEWQLSELAQKEQSEWNKHNQLERGNPVKVFHDRDFRCASGFKPDSYIQKY